MSRNGKKVLAVLMVAALGISLCAGEVEAAKKKPALSSKKIVLKVGKSKKLKVRNLKKSVKKKWKSKNKKIATVSKTGKVKAKKAGSTTVSCTFRYKGKKYVKKCKVLVKGASDASMETDQPGENRVDPADGNTPTVTQPGAGGGPAVVPPGVTEGGRLLHLRIHLQEV